MSSNTNVLVGNFPIRPKDGEPRPILYGPTYSSQSLDTVQATLFLSYILTWYEPPKEYDGLKQFIERDDGHKWIAKPVREWASETGLTVSQIRDAVEQLKFYGHIKTEVHYAYWAPNPNDHPDWDDLCDETKSQIEGKAYLKVTHIRLRESHEMADSSPDYAEKHKKHCIKMGYLDLDE